MSISAICVMCVVAAILACFLKQYKPEYAMLISLALSCAVILVICAELVPLTDKISSAFNHTGLDSDYITAMLKAVGICYITHFGNTVCKDCGQASAGEKIEIAGSVAIAVISLPVLTDLAEIAIKLTEI